MSSGDGYIILKSRVKVQRGPLLVGKDPTSINGSNNVSIKQRVSLSEVNYDYCVLSVRCNQITPTTHVQSNDTIIVDEDLQLLPHCPSVERKQKLFSTQ